MRDAYHRLVAVIDDDDAVRDSLRFLLEISGYPVATYGSATESLNQAPVDGLTCLLVDEHMPDLTGLQLVTRLRAQGVTLPVALITGSPSPDLLRLAHDLSVAKVLEKPLDDNPPPDFIERAGG